MKAIDYAILICLFVGVISSIVLYEEPIIDDVVGNMIDEHGCVVTAGFSYNVNINACVREWELNDTQREVATRLIDAMDMKNITVLSVQPCKDISTVYEIVLHHSDEIKKYFLDARPLRNVKNKTEFGCDIGFLFCGETGECFNASMEICGGGNNITKDICESIFGHVQESCLSSQTAIANVGDGFCCGNKEDIIIMPSNEICNTACEVIGYSSGYCASSCTDCLMLGQCSSGNMCACLY